jgi:hypothetical protein
MCMRFRNSCCYFGLGRDAQVEMPDSGGVWPVPDFEIGVILNSGSSCALVHKVRFRGAASFLSPLRG